MHHVLNWVDSTNLKKDNYVVMYIIFEVACERMYIGKVVTGKNLVRYLSV